MISRITTFIPLANRCLIKRIMPSAVTKGGIILSEKSTEKGARFGEVMSAGPGELDVKGNIIPNVLKTGDIVLLPEYQGTRVNMEDKDNEYMIFRDTEILGIAEGFKH